MMKGQIYEQEKNEEEARETYKQGVRSCSSNKLMRAVIINAPDLIARDIALTMLICVLPNSTQFLFESISSSYCFVFSGKEMSNVFSFVDSSIES